MIAQNLLALISELGTLTRRQIASLASLAPKANDRVNSKDIDIQLMEEIVSTFFIFGDLGGSKFAFSLEILL